jgi:hypothetical protein
MLRSVRVPVLVVVTLLSRTAVAGDLAWAKPGNQWCSIDWNPGQLARLRIDLRVKRRELVSLDDWLQVAPGGRWLAVRTKSSELHVFDAKGAEVWRRAHVGAFRFARSGDQLAVSSPSGIEVVSPSHPEPRQLADVRRAKWVGWVDGGLLVHAGQRLLHVDDAGHERTITTLPRDAFLVSSPNRAVFFSHGAMTDLDLAAERRGPTRKLSVTDRVVNADLAPDGSKVLFATQTGTYLIDGQSGPKELADGTSLSLSFSPDGSAYLWVGPHGGSLVSKGTMTDLPRDTIAARFRQDAGSELVLTPLQGNIVTWNPVTLRREDVGGVSPDDGTNFAGDIAGGAAVAFYCKKSGWVKEHSIPFDEQTDQLMRSTP